MLFFWFGAFLRFHRKALGHIKVLFPEFEEKHIESLNMTDFFAAESRVWTKVEAIHKSLGPEGVWKVLSDEQA